MTSSNSGQLEGPSVRGVLFDFSGTLFRLEQDESWLAGLAGPGGSPLDGEERAELMRRMTAPSGRIADMPAEYQDAWDRRDLDPALHRKVYTEVLRRSGIRDEHQIEAFYASVVSPDHWRPYPDAAEALRRLKETGVPAGVLSNIAWDIRESFVAHGMSELVSAVLMSYVEGLVKPDPDLFRRACERIDVPPERVLMIGDSAEADGAAARIGCRVALVEPLPTDQRPDGLLSALDAHGL